MNKFQSWVPIGTTLVMYSAPTINFKYDSFVLLMVDKNKYPLGFSSEYNEFKNSYLSWTCSITSIAVIKSNFY